MGTHKISRLACALATLVLLLGAAREARPGDPPNELRKRQTELEARVKEWDRALRGMIYSCPRCRGTGYGGGCPYCRGTGKVASKTLHKKVVWDLMSPAFRKRPGKDMLLAAAYRQMIETGKRPHVVGQIVGVELWDESHGVARVRPPLREGEVPGADPESRVVPLYWIYASEGTARRWYLFDAEADGPWPKQRMPPEEGPTPAPSGPDAFPDREALAKALGEAGLRHRQVDLRREDLTLVIDLARPKARQPGEQGLELCILDAAAAARVVRGAGTPKTPWERLRMRFLARYRDPYGRIDVRPHTTIQITRSELQKVVFDNLAPAELWALCSPEPQRHEGWREIPTVSAGTDESPDSGLPEGVDEALSAALAEEPFAHAEVLATLDEGALVIALSGLDAATPEGPALAEDTRRAAMAVRRGAEEGLTWRTLRIVFLAPWKHRLGRIEPRPHAVAEISREEFAQLVFENLDAAELWSAFRTDHPAHEGWKRVEPE